MLGWVYLLFQEDFMLSLTPINLAEAVFEPFWDPRLSGLAEWEIDPGDTHGLVVSQNWCWVTLEWARRPENGRVLCMHRKLELDCSGYDRLLVSINLPPGAVLTVSALTDQGLRRLEAAPSTGVKKEHALELQGGQRIEEIVLEVTASEEGIASGWVNWIGLQNSVQLERYLAQYRRFSSDWEGYLKPEGTPFNFSPTYGFLINHGELEYLRAEHQAHLEAGGMSPFLSAAEAAEALVPEAMIHDFVNFWGDTRYCRERDESHLLLRHGPAAAIGGLLLKDSSLLRLAARYALAIAFCDTWDDGMICSFPGSTFDHRCFVQSLCAYETALILDLAGECFTELGRDYILRRIGEHAIGNINQITWMHAYIYSCNQLAWFTPGRMLGYLALEQVWTRVKPYTELARQDLEESFESTILPDGGYVEGPSYFECVPAYGGRGLFHYARARGLNFAEVVPPSVLRTADFAMAMCSTDENNDLMPICDGHSQMSVETVAQMAALLPQSAWVAMYHKVLARLGGFPDSIIAWQLRQHIPDKGPDLPAFVYLPVMGVMASVRRLGNERVKLFLMGNLAGAGHTHEDKGSFILEFAGETFAIDPGTCDYSSGDAQLVTQCERHNMLVPTGLAVRPHPDSPLPIDIKPSGIGDDTLFKAEIDLAPSWDRDYRCWVRRWSSPTSDALLIRDEYELVRGSGVDFYWNTRLPVDVGEHSVTITGQRGRAVIDVPANCTVRVEEFSIAGEDFQRRVAFHREGTSGVLEVQVRLVLLS
jgi:hypothetical protein